MLRTPVSDCIGHPDGLETDEYDPHALHFGVVNAENKLMGTIRLVNNKPLGFPLLKHCALFDAEAERLETLGVLEMSRLVIGREFRRRYDDGLYGCASVQRDDHALDTSAQRRYLSTIFRLFKGLAQYCLANAIPKLLFATDAGLVRMAGRYKESYCQVGPETEYYGPVIPCLVDAARFDAIFRVYNPDISI